MRFSVITPNYNGALYLEKTILSVLSQKKDVDLEYIVVDGGSSDGSIEIINKYADQITHCVIEKDSGPANAINKGLRLATGDIVSWLNGDDIYYPGTLARVRDSMKSNTENSMCFGNCKIVDETGKETRSAISSFKELFFPVSCRFTYQCINYLSQPALFFRSSAVRKAGLLREDMVAAWDYDFVLRLWHFGTAVRVIGDPLAAFRWHENSISGQNFRLQFQEEYMSAKADAGTFSLQTALHFLVRWGIVGIYSAMSRRRNKNCGV
jgi:glycosyltransferase involved in cell wall biosynthesis